MVEKIKNLQKVGFSQKEFFYIFVLTELRKENQYISSMFLNLQNTFPAKKHSRSQFYRVVKEMDESYRWIDPLPTKGNKIMYRITQPGSLLLDNYKSTFYLNYSSLLITCERFLHKNGHTTSPDLTEEQQRYFSKIINVKELLFYFILKRLCSTKNRYYGSEIRQELKSLYGWHSSEGYLYDVLHQMEASLLIESQWNDIERRRKKYFKITEKGIKAFPTIEQNTHYKLQQIHQFISDILTLFNRA